MCAERKGGARGEGGARGGGRVRFFRKQPRKRQKHELQKIGDGEGHRIVLNT
jgi:hypothetical protein